MPGVRPRIAVSIVALLGAVLFPAAAVAAAPHLDYVTFTVYACPSSIQTPEELANAGGPFEACAVAGKTGEFGWLPTDFHWRIDPVEYNLQASLRGRGRPLSNPEATAGGTCDSSILQCTAFQSYGWFNTPIGKFTLSETTLPSGYTFGWADAYVDGTPTAGTVDAAAHSLTIAPASGSASVYVQFINLAQ
jgi:hypothetical protein